MTAAPGTVTVRNLVFDSHEALRDYALQLNDNGKTANVSIMDANGNAVLACLAGCYADEFYYYSPNEDGYMHPAGCCECDDERSDWKPRFPVTALAVSSRLPMAEHDPFDILCAVNRGEATKSDAICPRCRPT